MLFLGCSEDNKQKNEKFTQDVSTQQTNNYEHFPIATEKINNTFDRKTIYIPVYSHVYISENVYTRLSITLSIRNSDLLKDLYVESIDYYNTEGKLVKQYIKEPHLLKPLSTVDYVVNLEDMSGGNGAKFLINVASKNKINTPIIQAIMTNTLGNSNLCFLTEGHILE